MQKTFGPLIIDIKGTELLPEDREFIQHPLVGGVILFTRNYESLRQLHTLTRDIRQTSDKPLLIMVDQEGGRVQRFRQHFTTLPAAIFYGQADKDAVLLAETGGWIMATELLMSGIDLSLAPVLDLNKGVSSIIGDRAFDAHSVKVIQLASAFIRGMKNAGMAATGKHFPGHGSVVLDSHKALPVDERTWEQIEADDLQPFIQLINADIPALMTAHVLFPCVDKMPVSFSRYWLRNILRDTLHFKGVVMSDDLDMKGANITDSFADRMQMACDAGCDIILLCNNRTAVIQVLDNVPSSSYLLNFEKYEMLRGRFTNTFQTFDENTLWRERRDYLREHYDDLR